MAAKSLGTSCRDAIGEGSQLRTLDGWSKVECWNWIGDVVVSDGVTRDGVGKVGREKVG